MAVPSSPGWKFGYVPSPGEWNNTFAGKVDFPAPLAQGGTGGQTAFDGNYNLQQRIEVVTPTQAGAPLTFYSLRTDLTAVAISLPPANTCQAGDWIDLLDTGNNASVNNITVTANGSDTILSNSSSTSSLLLNDNGSRCILVTDGVSAWRTGIAAVASSPPVPRQIAGTAYTLQLADAGQYLQFTSDDAVTVTVPPHASIGYILGSVIVIEQFGAGQITISPGMAVTVNGHNAKRSGGQYAVMQLKNGSAGSSDTWTLLGDCA